MSRRAKRYIKTQRKLHQREYLLQKLGEQGGLLYDKHIAKIRKSLGYMRDGNVTHYVRCGFSEKTRDRNRYGKVLYFLHSDAQKMLNYKQQIEEWKSEEK